jgi:hypothetical protein
VLGNPSNALGTHAALEGLQLDLTVRLTSGGTRISRMPEIWAVPSGVVEVSAADAPGAYSDGKFKLRAAAAGTAEVHVRAGIFEATRTVRVVSPGDVLEGSLWTLANPDFSDVDLRDEVLGAEVTDTLSASQVAWMKFFPSILTLAWRLRDGSLALGGSSTVTANPPNFLSQSPLGVSATEVWVLPSAVGIGKTVTLRAQVGTAVLDRTLTLQVEP